MSLGTLPLVPIFTQDSRCAGVVFPNGSSLHSLSVGRTPLYSAPLWHDRVDTPYLPYYPCWYLSTPNQITLSGRGNPVAASLHLWKREGHYWHISMPTSSGSPFKTLWTWFYLQIFHHRYPLTEDCIHHHVKFHGWERVPLGHATLYVKFPPKVPTWPGHH